MALFKRLCSACKLLSLSPESNQERELLEINFTALAIQLLHCVTIPCKEKIGNSSSRVYILREKLSVEDLNTFTGDFHRNTNATKIEQRKNSSDHKIFVFRRRSKSERIIG